MDRVGEHGMNGVLRHETIHACFLGQRARLITAGDHDDRDGVLLLAKRFDEGRAIHVGHVTISDEQIDPTRMNGLESVERRGVGSDVRRRDGLPGHGCDDRADCVIVVNDHDVKRMHLLQIDKAAAKNIQNQSAIYVLKHCVC